MIKYIVVFSLILTTCFNVLAEEKRNSNLVGECFFEATGKSALTTKQFKYITSLSKGVSAKTVIKKIGMPFIWGETKRDSKITHFDFALDWTYNGNLGPLDFIKTDSKQVTWLYLKPGYKRPFDKDSCVVLFFTNNKLDKVTTGALGDMDCG